MKNTTYGNALILNLGGIGDFITTLPVISALKKSGATITSVVWPAQEDLAQLVPDIDRVVPLPRQWENDPELSLFGRALAGKFGYDLVLDFAFMPRAGVLTREARGRRTVGFALDNERYPWYTDIYPNVPGEARLERNYRLIGQLGLPRPVRPLFPIRVPKDVDSEVSYILRGHGVKSGSGPIAIHPGSGNNARNWPPERFAALADKLRIHTNRPVLLLGGQRLTYDGGDEIQLTSRVQELMTTDAIDLGGRLTTAELISVLGRCSLFVGNNSGPAHLAATIAGAPCLLIWAPRNERVWRPMGGEVVLVTAQPDCSEECLLNKCDKIAECVSRIGVDDVFGTYLETIGSLGQVAAVGGGR
jgi:ADP-heptose:LPS heptosyltransferase